MRNAGFLRNGDTARILFFDIFAGFRLSELNYVLEKENKIIGQTACVRAVIRADGNAAESFVKMFAKRKTET